MYAHTIQRRLRIDFWCLRFSPLSLCITHRKCMNLNRYEWCEIIRVKQTYKQIDVQQFHSARIVFNGKQSANTANTRPIVAQKKNTSKDKNVQTLIRNRPYAFLHFSFVFFHAVSASAYPYLNTRLKREWKLNRIGYARKQSESDKKAVLLWPHLVRNFHTFK